MKQCCGDCVFWSDSHKRLIENKMLRKTFKDKLSECTWVFDGNYPDSFSEKQRGQIFSDIVMFSSDGESRPCFKRHAEPPAD